MSDSSGKCSPPCPESFQSRLPVARWHLLKALSALRVIKGITFADCVIRFSTKEPLWVMPVSGNPSAEITSSGVTGIIPITSDVAGTLTPSDWNAPDNAGPSGSTNGSSSEPEFYFVVILAGQSNGMAYGEGCRYRIRLTARTHALSNWHAAVR